MRNLHDVIATDIPPPIERVPLELDEDIGRRDAWMFSPLIAAGVTLPLAATVLLGFSAWHLINNEPSFVSKQPTTFASRWPDRSLPLVVVR